VARELFYKGAKMKQLTAFLGHVFGDSDPGSLGGGADGTQLTAQERYLIAVEHRRQKEKMARKGAYKNDDFLYAMFGGEK
jgi:hypothetical protein